MTDGNPATDISPTMDGIPTTDGSPIDTREEPPTDRPTSVEPTTDAALVRRVRWRLLAWSGGSTLVVLLVLGSVLYAAVAGSLAKAATDQLSFRAKSVVDAAVNTVVAPFPGAPPPVFQGVSYYWHFVDVVWVGLYACLFLLK